MDFREDNNEERQNARANMNHLLRILTPLEGQECIFHLADNTTVSGTFKGFDIEGIHLIVSDVQSHLGIIPVKLLRTDNVIHFVLKNVDNGSSVIGTK